MRRVLVLRPEPGASATLARARRRGLDAIATPLFKIEAIKWEAPDAAQFDSLLLTSANALRKGGEELSKLRALPVHAVGEATAEAAREAGFEIAATGEAGVDKLLESVEPDARLLHLCGEHRREPEARHRVTVIPVYRTIAVAAPNLSVAPGSVALIHSPRAAGRFAELVEERGSIAIAAISPAAAVAAGSGWQSVDTAETMTDEALLALAARLCNTSSPK